VKVLLVIPTYNYKRKYPTFLSVSDLASGFAYLSSSLEEGGHVAYGLNLNNITGYSSAYDMINDNITQALESVKPDLVGLGGLCIDYKFLKDAIQIIRKTKVKIVLGGGIVNNDTEFIFNLLKPDFCILGEGEETIVKLCDALEKGEDLESIENLGYWEE